MKHYRLTMYKDGNWSAVALARDLSAKYGLDYRAAAYDDHGNLIEHGRKLTLQKLDAPAAFP